MAKPAGVSVKTKDNSRKKYQEHEAWMKRKKLNRPYQQYDMQTHTWGKIMEPVKVNS
jgi:hypothetical protein